MNRANGSSVIQLADGTYWDVDHNVAVTRPAPDPKEKPIMSRKEALLLLSWYAGCFIALLFLLRYMATHMGEPSSAARQQASIDSDRAEWLRQHPDRKPVTSACYSLKGGAECWLPDGLICQVEYPMKSGVGSVAAIANCRLSKAVVKS